jgi:signal transduction histidine kinase
LNRSNVLIVSDDPEFARTVAARWQSERHIPEITLATSDVCHPASRLGCDLVIVGPVHGGRLRSVLSAINAFSGTAVLYVPTGPEDTSELHIQYPHLLIMPKHDGWAGTLVLISIEALRRIEAINRAQQAEHNSLACQHYATLGRYILDMRPSINNALTSVLGNADLLLLEPGQNSGERREQIRAIQTMGLRLNEIMQRFSSLASEMRADEKESQAETEIAAGRVATTP